MSEERDEAREEIFKAVDRERDYQDAKATAMGWKPKKSPAEFLLVMRGELAEAEEAWLKKTHAEVMKEILQVVAVGVAAIEQNGLFER
jgi:hypothetical protein